jgi:hypothetical protein
MLGVLLGGILECECTIIEFDLATCQALGTFETFSRNENL